MNGFKCPPITLEQQESMLRARLTPTEAAFLVRKGVTLRKLTTTSSILLVAQFGPYVYPLDLKVASDILEKTQQMVALVKHANQPGLCPTIPPPIPVLQQLRPHPPIWLRIPPPQNPRNPGSAQNFSPQNFSQQNQDTDRVSSTTFGTIPKIERPPRN